MVSVLVSYSYLVLLLEKIEYFRVQVPPKAEYEYEYEYEFRRCTSSSTALSSKAIGERLNLLTAT